MVKLSEVSAHRPLTVTSTYIPKYIRTLHRDDKSHAKNFGTNSTTLTKMPAIIDDPASPTIYRVSGAQPFPDPNKPALPASITPRQVTLRDRQTVATVVPFLSRDQVPPSLLLYLADQFAKEIIKGDTYPMMEPMSHEKFAAYWFQNFGAIMLLGDIEKPQDVIEGKDWSKECLGSFYIKPNYPGRSSHICNAGFLVTDASRNRGVGRLMGEAYLNWAPKLGYSYSVFNLVYETNVASCRIWDALGFKRIGKVPKCGNLRSYPGRLVDAIIYGRDLAVGDESEEGPDELVSQERFEKIKFYLKHGKYPDGADRAEKSRLRSSATHYTLSADDVLMLNNKECIADPGRQYDIAREVHAQRAHGGINKTTATIAERYHWSRIKDTVSDVIRACTECNEGKDKDKDKDTAKVSASVVVGRSTTINPRNSVNASTVPPSNSRPAVSNSSILAPPRASSPEIMSNEDHVLRYIDNDSSLTQPSLPSAGLDMGQNDPDLSAIYQFLATPPSPPSHSVTHHEYQPIDPRLTTHDPPFVNQLHVSHAPFDRPVTTSTVPMDEMDGFFASQPSERDASQEETRMDIDDAREHHLDGFHGENHNPYPDFYDTFKEDDALQYTRTNHRPPDLNDE